jgi:ABC-type nitrate/sulfonate/bicarbonate transport system substrate-binding protein
MKIAVPDLVSNSYFPAIAALELDFFAREGLSLELQHVFPVSRCLERLGAGELDFVAGAAHALPQVFPGGKGAKLLVALAQHMYWLLVLRSDLGVKRNEIAAVKGLRIGAAPVVEQGLRGLLAEAGIDVERDGVTILPVPGSTEPGASFGLQAAKALEAGLIDGFWANALGAECAVRSGAGSVILDVRRGEGPIRARDYTFPALMTSDRVIEENPHAAAAAVRAIVAVQRELKRDVSRATEVGRRLFPAYEASLIAEVVRRDLPYYDPAITPSAVREMDGLNARLGTTSVSIAYGQAVATGFSQFWYSGDEPQSK